MQLRFFDFTGQVSPEELAADIMLLPEWRRSKTLAIKSYSARILSVKAFLLLAGILREKYDLDHVPEFSYGEHGKPFFRDFTDIHFNISHCRRAAMCAVSSNPVGCDIETLDRHISDRVLKRCFSNEEKSRVYSAENPQREFAMLWTQKEAVVKCSGKGIDDMMPRMLLSGNTQGLKIESKVNRDKGYAFSVCEKTT